MSAIALCGLPEAGDLALCSRGFLGLITQAKPEEFEYPDGTTGRAYVGVHLEERDGKLLGDPWSSRSPIVVASLTELRERGEKRRPR
jgi:hypothetical protein